MADKIDVFTAALRSEFYAGYDAVPEQPPIMKATSEIPSTARVENYSWLSPAPGIEEYNGYRRFGKIGEIKYALTNKQFDGSMEVLKIDVDDDQTGGYKTKSSELGEAAKVFPSEEVLATLHLGSSTACFDGSNFFADSHTIGTGDNAITYNCASDDGTTHYIYALYTGRKIKPMIWQNRMGPEFNTDAGTPEASKAQIYRYWIDLRGAAGYGYWFDAVKCTISDTPTTAELQTILGNISAQFRTFQYPKNMTSERARYPHAQTKFGTGNLLLACSATIEHLVRQVLHLSLISSTENAYKDFADYLVSPLLNA